MILNTFFLFSSWKMESKTEEEPYRDPRAMKTLATFTDTEIYGMIGLY